MNPIKCYAIKKSLIERITVVYKEQIQDYVWMEATKSTFFSKGREAGFYVRFFMTDPRPVEILEDCYVEDKKVFHKPYLMIYLKGKDAIRVHRETRKEIKELLDTIIDWDEEWIQFPSYEARYES